MEKTKVSVDARSCTACNYSGTTLGQGRTLTMVCRFNPPTVVSALLQTQDGLAWNTASSWPAVGQTDFCGKFEPRLN